MISLTELSAKIKGEKNVALICHIRPDGDSLGAALALKLALQYLGIKAEVFCEDTVPPRFLFLKEMATVKTSLDGDYGAIIAIDCADISRLGCFAEKFLAHKNTYSIDHHVSNGRFAKINFIVETSSNCENILDLVEEMGVPIGLDMANLLALGVVTDTGNFRHKNVTPKTLYSAAKLVEKGADLNTIYFNMFQAQTKARAKLFGRTMEKIRYFFDGRLALATVRLEDLSACYAEQSETEGFIDFVMGVIGVEVGACVMETQKNKFKVSFRSKGADVNAVAGTFGGGGHTLASGCQLQGEYEEVVDKLCFAVKRELPDCL